MAQSSLSSTEPPPSSAHSSAGFLRKLFGRNNAAPAPVGPFQPREPEPEPEPEPDSDDPQSTDLTRRASRKVVPGLPRVQTFKRQHRVLTGREACFVGGQTRAVVTYSVTGAVLSPS
ncbi:protein kinase [Colletotrichum higginsianum]|nr:protein kinase [Colletotrichum higginsianum]